MSYIEKHKRGFAGTIIFHVVVLILLLLFGFFTKLPLPGEEGILVNFGNSDQGSGPQEPAPSRQTSPPVVQEKEVVTPPPVTPPPPTPAVSQPEVKEEVMTQDFEETVAIDAAKKKQEEDKRRLQEQENKRKQEELDRQRELEQEAQRKVELERQRQAEIERQRLAAEAERQRQAEEERKRKEAEEQKIAEINNRASVLRGGGAGTSDSESTGQGVSSSGGNQGSQNGSPNSPNYGDGGGQGNGISYDLGDRSAQSLPKPYYPGNEEGVVVVQVTVDKYGKVTSAEPGVRGSTTYNAQLLSAAKQAAMKARFNIDESAPAFQQGTITYSFRLN